MVLETVLERENRAYLLHSFPAAAAMSQREDDHFCDSQQLSAAHLMRFQHGRQSLDSITRKTSRKSVTFRSVEQLNRRDSAGDEHINRIDSGEQINRRYSSERASEEQLNRRGSGERQWDCCGGSEGRADLKLELEGASMCGSCKRRTSVSVVSSHSAPVTPSCGCGTPAFPPASPSCGCGTPAFPPVTVDVTARRKHRTQLSVDPAFPRNADCCSRPFTRVNLVLRSPSSAPQPPIDIASTGGGGLTYTTCSYNRGFQSRLQISIGAGGRGGSISAARSRPPPFASRAASAARLRPATSLPDVATTSALLHMSPADTALLNPEKQVLVSKQLEQKQRLEKELEREKEKLRFMEREIELMERRLDGASTTLSTSSVLHSRANKVQELRDEILRLRDECTRMTTEVDQSDVPLGETSEEFYRHRVYTEQMSCPASLPNFPTRGDNDTLHIPRHSSLDLSGSAEQREAAAATTAAAAGDPGAAAAGGPGAAAAVGDGPSWTCHVCTFRNHPLLKQCEQCDMPRINLGVFGGTQNIHIHVTHHNFPSRREAHSWVV
ncbi:TGF-beta-activated kinase 1 and MAP3K7-binding protein 2 [Nilaparvata lugens]|uniref:TGF-beta-activated kinase 1 and MAP3K7-binding protein 2 n=1 Tax=Nilaparvata lugens TaxID=108931 RepID=UPI00193D84E6|nr:TGF-beta-activated kinase 1 and MAP3K7-binding protein 2 [Nilaparvata lugens]